MSDEKFFKAGLAAAVLFAAGVALKLARPVLIPFLLAVFLSYLTEPVLFALTRCRCPRPWAVVVVLALVFVVLYLLGLLVYSSGRAFVNELPKYQDRLDTLQSLLESGLGPLRLDVPSALKNLNFNEAGAFILKALGPFFDVLGKLFLVFLFLVFIVSGRGRMEAKLAGVAGAPNAGRLKGVLNRVNRQVQKYLVLKTVIGIANGLEVWLVLTLLGVDFAALFGVIAFVLNYIPNIGSAIATVLRVGFAYFQFGTFWTPFLVLVITVGADAIIGSLIEPRVLGRGLGLSPLLVVFSLLFWGWLWGIPGMMLSVPLTAVIRIICQNIKALEPVAVLMGP
jgi:AI-2 transport protein TqsA